MFSFEILLINMCLPFFDKNLTSLFFKFRYQQKSTRITHSNSVLYHETALMNDGIY